MSHYTRSEVLQEAKKIAEMIAETEEVAFFKRAEAQINQNEKVQRIIKQIKAVQKQAVNLQHYGKSEALKKAEDRLDALFVELDDIPIVQEFKQSQNDVNDLLQIVAQTISSNVTQHVIESTDGDIVTGLTGSAASIADSCGSNEAK
ncbi:hypothetical protein G4V62_03495 [Bacillaceae bacterium SIJ1]|uniref:RicAFT regulatory complex protein RicA family protein n=1 Tax=Litoribacterium kuwaitense TaxID=1398745 RepID=UPI0013EC51BA|nr:RicAFT regulatory complex protein RicA family protein [Litoribacterium kuwaitense]NGP44059.1 hypothetical protein [Litoribacterium kuwaitense]